MAHATGGSTRQVSVNREKYYTLPALKSSVQVGINSRDPTSNLCCALFTRTPIYVAPTSTNEPTVEHEPSVSAALPPAEHESRSYWDSNEHGCLLHQLLPQTSSSRQRSLRSADAAVAAKDGDAVVGQAAASGRSGGGGGGGVCCDRDSGRRRRGRVVDAIRLPGGCGRSAGGGPAVERPQGVPAVARQLAGEHRAGELAPPVGAPEVQHRQAGAAAEGPRARASSDGAIPGAALRHGRLLHPLGKLGR